MKNILKIIKEELSPGKIIANVLTNAMLSFLLYLVIYLAYTTSFINHQTMSGELFVLPNIIAFSTLLYTFLLSLSEWDKVVNNKSYIYSLKSAGIFEFSIYFGKIKSLILHSWIAFITSSVVIIPLSGASIRFSYFCYFMLFLLLSAIMIILATGFIKLLIRSNNFAQLHVIFLFILLFLLSGLFIPHYLYSGPIYTILKYLPFGIILDGCRKLLINNEFILIELLYVSILTISLAVTNYILYKKELEK